MVKPKIDKGTGSGMSKEDCLALGEKALSEFTGDELQGYVSSVFQRAKQSSLKGQAAIKQAMKEINDEQKAVLFHDCARKANNVAIYDDKAKAIESGKTEIREMLDYRGKNQGNTVVAAQNAARSRMINSFFDETWSHEEEDFSYNNDNSADIMNALDGKNASPMAKKIAARVEKYRATRNAASVKSGVISIEHLSNYKYLDHNHDPVAMMNGGMNMVQKAKNLLRGIKSNIDAKAAWVNDIVDRLDLKAMFDGTKGIDLDGNVDMNYVRGVLENTYENITTGKNDIFTKSIVANDREAVKKKMRMFLLFKDWKSWSGYNEKYGQGDFAKALITDMMKSGGKIGMAESFGDSPLHMFTDLKKIEQKQGRAKPFYETDRSYNLKNELTFQRLLGANPTSVRPGLTEFLAGFRSLTSMNRLLNIAILSLPDQAQGFEYVGRFGVNRFKGMGYFLANTLNNKLGQLAFPERQEIARQFKLLSDAHLGYIQSSLKSRNVGQFFNRVTSKVLKGVGMEAMDNGNKISAMTLISDQLGKYSSTGWDSLPDALRKQLSNHNITPQEWDLLRKKTKSIYGKKLFTTDNASKLTDAELREHHASLEKKVPLTQLKNDLYRKIYSMFDTASQNTILSPGEFTRANMAGSNTPGTFMGELWTAISQFKQYPVDYLDRVWNQGFKNADGMMSKTAFAMRMMVMTLPLSFISTWMGYYAKGKTLPDMDDPKFWTGLALPGMGVFLSILNNGGGNDNLLFNLGRSPSIGLIQNMLGAAMAEVHGDQKAAAKKFKKAMRYLLPVDTIPFISPFLREGLGDRPYLEHGQKQVYGA
jgi:hypothetical protein